MSLKRLIIPSGATPLKRSSSPALDEILGCIIPVQEHGFLKVVDYMGNDQAIENAARMSYGEETRQVTETKGLLNYLMRHKHTSPFEMCELKLHVRLPIFVMRQWVRHRMASLNEYSARYSVMKDEFYIPPLPRLKEQSQANKQGSGLMLPYDKAVEIQELMLEANEEDFELYTRLLADNLSRETARNILPVNIYTEMVWKSDLHNLFHFLLLRDDAHAQAEIQEYAQIIDGITAYWVPYAHSAFLNYRKYALTFSLSEQALLRKLMDRFVISGELLEGVNISDREVKEFEAKLRLLTFER